MRKNSKWVTDEQVESEINELSKSEFVKLARKEKQIKYRRRQYLYQLRDLEKRGKKLAELGVTENNIEWMIFEGDEKNEDSN